MCMMDGQANASAEGGLCGTITCHYDVPFIGFAYKVSASAGTMPAGEGVQPTLIASRPDAAVCAGTCVRRLTPRECERLQGFPDDWTRISWRGKPASGCPDSPRYRALGNSMAIPVMRWIGRRIAYVDNMEEEISAMLSN